MAAIINVEWQNNFADAAPGRLKKKKKKLSCPDSIESIHQETLDKAVACFIC